MISFVIIRLGIAALFIILQQLVGNFIVCQMNVELLLPEFFFCEGTMQPLSVFWSL